MAQNGIEQMFYEIPPVTRVWLSASVLTTAACFFDVISPFTLYLSWRLIMKGQVWRLLSSFVFFGAQFNLEFFFQMFFLMRYCRSLEESSFRNRTADFFWFILLAIVLMLAIAPLFKVNFLGSSLNFTMVYVWARRNPYARMNLFGIFNFNAPYLPWVLMGFSVLLGSSGVVDLLGIAVGHVYYFLEDIYPMMVPSRVRLLKTPAFVRALFDRAAGNAPFVILPEPDAPAAAAAAAAAANHQAEPEDFDSDDEEYDDVDDDNDHDNGDEQAQPRQRHAHAD